MPLGQIPPPYVLKRAEGYFAATILRVAIPLLLILLLAGCPQTNTIETRTLAYSANLPEGNTLASNTTVPSTKTYAAGATVEVDKVLELDDGTPSTGWSTKADGSGTSYQAGDKINLNENTTLYAQWPAAQKIMDTAAAVEAIGKMEQGEKLDLTLGGEIDLSQLKDALAKAKGTVSLDLSQTEGLTTIGEGVFQGITALTAITLPEEVTSIGANAFASSGLTSIILQSSAANITIDDTAIPSGASIAVPSAELAAYTQKFPTYTSQFIGSIQYRVSYLFETTDGKSYVPATSAGVSDPNGMYQDKRVSGIPGQQTNETAPTPPTGFMAGQVTQVHIVEDAVVEVKYERKTVTITINSFTGAGTSGLSSTYTGKYGAATNISPTPPANFTFVKWVDNSGNDVTITTFPANDLPIEAANALYTNAAGHPVYPAYLTVQRKSYAEAENDDVGQEKPSWAGGNKTYSTQIADRPMTHTPYDAFTFDGTSQQPTKGQLVVTTGNTTGLGSFRIPALNKLVKTDGTIRLFAAADIRYRGCAEGNGDCGDGSAGGSDFLVAYSDDGGATWTRKAIDVPNVFNEKGQPTAATYGHDLGDPQLWTVGNTIYVGGVTGTGILGRGNNQNSGLRVFKSVDYGETWTEDTNISTGRNTYAFLWNDSTKNLIQATQNGYANLPCPGHGIVLTQDVPGTNMKKGMTVVPMQGGNNPFKAYLVYGTGEPSTWQQNGSQTIDTSSGQGEWQVCQLDDGTLFGVGKRTDKNITNARYTSTGWTEIASDPWLPRGNSQSSVLKIVDGNGSTKYGVVAFTSPKSAGAKTNANATDDKGRDKVTISFGRDITGVQSISGSQSPIDSSERYYIQIRKMGQRFFGYTDMVMVNNEVLGIIYECFDNANNDIDGLRFMTVDVSEVVKKLSVKN